ncbi:type II CRISPR-associated endonuclease Cas1 [Mycoplasma zalophidermidis]|uniref:type II CRISPR-associated endonuclease Cas1 n=1 Tax=Mycoplasma zalophidermidis TaxID=398174 RepID=UPI001C121A1B|nr:type II CRISPR-associated endonuclease Cas1 [Mycoplasma zalophidermidis]MBU4689960.1 type II CRISPR-associated endonuclease Cas1 [Mycoplasma zalophidermidis]
MKKIIEISKSNYVNMFLNNLVVTKNGIKIIIPTTEIETVIFENDRAIISIPLINELIDKGVNIIFCDRNFMPHSLIIPYQGHYNMKIFQEQITWNDSFKCEIWTKLVKAKIKNSIKTLINLNVVDDYNLDKLNTYYQNVKYLDPDNKEAHVAKLYFKLLFGEKFVRSNDNDIKNTFLNYGYAILLSYITRYISSKGYDSRIGLHHKSYNNNFALSTDLIEPFRCIIDKFVFEFVNQNELLLFQDYKQQLFDLFEQYIIVNNSKIKISSYIQKFIVAALSGDDLEGYCLDYGTK